MIWRRTLFLAELATRHAARQVAGYLRRRVRHARQVFTGPTGRHARYIPRHAAPREVLC